MDGPVSAAQHSQELRVTAPGTYAPAPAAISLARSSERVDGALAHRGRHLQGLRDQLRHRGARQRIELDIDLPHVGHEFRILDHGVESVTQRLTRSAAIPGGPIKARPMALPLA